MPHIQTRATRKAEGRQIRPPPRPTEQSEPEQKVTEKVMYLSRKYTEVSNTSFN